MDEPHLLKKSLKSIRFDYSTPKKSHRQYQFIHDDEEYVALENMTKFSDLKYRINSDSGQVEIQGTRFLKLGKVELYDPIEDRPVDVDSEKYIMILDTQTSTAYCLNVKELYSKYISRDRKYVESERGKFLITQSTKSIVLSEIFNK